MLNIEIDRRFAKMSRKEMLCMIKHIAIKDVMHYKRTKTERELMLVIINNIKPTAINNYVDKWFVLQTASTCFNSTIKTIAKKPAATITSEEVKGKQGRVVNVPVNFVTRAILLSILQRMSKVKEGLVFHCGDDKKTLLTIFRKLYAKKKNYVGLPIDYISKELLVHFIEKANRVYDCNEKTTGNKADLQTRLINAMT
jgi:ribosomal protein S18